MWNLATTVAAAGWFIANSIGGIVVANHPMYLPHLVANTLAIYTFSTWAGAYVDSSGTSSSFLRSIAVGVLLAPLCFTAGAAALALVNLSLGFYDDCCSNRFGGDFGLGTGSVTGTLWHAFARPLGWIVLFGLVPSMVLGFVYGTLLYLRRPRPSRGLEKPIAGNSREELESKTLREEI